MKLSYLIPAIILFFNPYISKAQYLVFSQPHSNGIYRSGEFISINAAPDTPRSSDTLIIITCRNFLPDSCTSLVLRGDANKVYNGIARGPSTVIFEGSSGKFMGSTGIIIDPDKFRPSTRRPSDFNAFWKKEKNELKALPEKVTSSPVQQSDSDYVCLDIELNCTGPKPVRGYFAKPVSAKPGTLPIVIFFHAAGVSGDWCRSKPEIALKYASMGKGALSFDLNAHGMLNGQPDSYYVDLENNELKNYALKCVEDRNSVYFRGMYLRLLRTIDFLASMPEWDGKRILVTGESQGGGQALAAAGLDKRVSAVVAIVPAMCDWGGSLAGRKGSWPYPFDTDNDIEKMLKALPYYDVAHILKGSKATIVAEIGLVDQTCPSSAIYSALNQAKGKKIIYTLPYRGHHMTQPFYKEKWEKEILQPIDDFITDYLR